MLFVLFACFAAVYGSGIPEINNPQPYRFLYTIKDKEGVQHRPEAGNGAGIVEGNYGFIDNKGIGRQVDYVADHGGFRGVPFVPAMYESNGYTGLRSNCDDISGIWQNELGSNMTLHIDPSNRISGKFRNAVDLPNGPAVHTSDITGLFLKQRKGALLAFSVLFNHGDSLATWVGQCMVCEGKEILFTTWTLRSYIADPVARWRAVNINQNTFWRIRGQRENDIESFISAYPVTRHQEQSRYPHFTTSSEQVQRLEGLLCDSYGCTFPNFNPVRPVSGNSHPVKGGMDITGKWISQDSDEVEFFGKHNGLLEGKYHSADLVGQKDGNASYTAVTFTSASGRNIRSWTGHIYDSSAIYHEILEASWLEHEFIPSCIRPRDSVKFGVRNFTRTSPGRY